MKNIISMALSPTTATANQRASWLPSTTPPAAIRRGRDYVRVVILATVDADDVADAGAHSFLATSGPVMRASSGKVAAMMPRAARIPPAVMR